MVKSFEVFLELEGGVKLHLSVISRHLMLGAQITCERGISGGPKAISAALVPGRILRVEPSSSPDPETNDSASVPKGSPIDGDRGPIWTSVKGGGLGSRGELDGETPAAVMVE